VVKRRHERPIPRVNPGGKKVWVARYTGADGKRRSAGTYALKGACKAPSARGDCCAQHAIDAAYEAEENPPISTDTLGAYAETWSTRHPRSARTNKTNDGRIRQVLDVELEGVKLRDWPYSGLRRRHANELLDVMLREQGRAASGAQNVLRALSAMTENAIDDEVTEANPFKGVTVRANDPRVRKAPKAVRVWSWEEMHALTRAAATAPSTPKKRKPGAPRPVPVTGPRDPSPIERWRPVYGEAMCRVLADCGLRLGELLPLQRRDLKGPGKCDERGCDVTVPHLHVERTAWEGSTMDGTKTDHGQPDPGRTVPVPPVLEEMLRRLPARIDTLLLFPTPRGALWRERNFYRDVWVPARDAVGTSARPHEFRHSWVSLLSAAGVDPADLAAIAGHSVQTMHGKYTHGLGRSHEAIRKAVGQ
jgi:integrase